MISVNPSAASEQGELLKIILDFIGKMAWPCIALIAIIIFKDEIKKLLLNAKKIDLPGGISVETIQQDIDKAKELSNEVEKESNPETRKITENATPGAETDANKKMLELGLVPSPSGLNINYYRSLANTDPRLALMGLRTDLEIMLRNLANGFKVKIDSKDSTSIIVLKLFNNGSITLRQYELINTLFTICNSAAHGVSITKKQSDEVLDIAKHL